MTLGALKTRRAGVIALTSSALLAGPVGAASATDTPETTPTTRSAAAGPSGITAKGAYLLDSGKNKKLWGKATGTARETASTTKIMTADVVLHQADLNLDKKVKVKQAYRDYVTREGASTADLKTGDPVTVRQLLYAMLLPSGCDAAYALADTFGDGDTAKKRVQSFIGKMNSRAKELGMTRSEFDSFDGISQHGNNTSTPRDMAKLARDAMKSQTFRTVVKTPTTKQKTSNGRTYTWTNTNQLLGSYKGAIGIKTGTGSRAGHCLVFAANRDGKEVVGVVLNGPKRYKDAAAMLDWAYKSHSARNMKLRQLPANAQRD